MPRDDAKLLELRQVSAELDRRAARLEIDQAQAIADRADIEGRIQDLAIQRQIIAEQRGSFERVVRTYSDDRTAQVTRG